jgi:hypothetical protein
MVLLLIAPKGNAARRKSGRSKIGFGGGAGHVPGRLHLLFRDIPVAISQGAAPHTAMSITARKPSDFGFTSGYTFIKRIFAGHFPEISLGRSRAGGKKRSRRDVFGCARRGRAR